MINRKLRAMLLTLSFLGAPFLKVMPFTWAPVGDGVDSEGYATTGGVYQYGDLIDELPGDFNSSFASTPENCVLNIYGHLRNPDAADTDGDGLPDEVVLDDGGEPIFSSLKIDGDVRLDARCCGGCDMKVNINTDVILEPYTNSAGVSQIDGATSGVFAGSDGLCYAQVFFNAEAGRTICVNVDHNLEFRGRTVDPTVQDFTDMVVTFNGAGRVIFKLADGTAVLFNGQIDDTTPILVDVNGQETLPIVLDEAGEEAESCVFNASGAGTKVYITMDQTADQAVSCGQHKVTFMRKRRLEELSAEMQAACECPTCGGDQQVTFLSPKGVKSAKKAATKDASKLETRACPTCPDCSCECTCIPCCPASGCEARPDLRVMVYVGHNSLITYLSDNLTGLPDASSCFCPGGYGSIAFDPSNSGAEGTGRMVLMIKGAYDISFEPDATEGTVVARYPFNDGAVVVAGHYVECDPLDPDKFTPELVRTTVDYSTPAGIQALFSVCDIVCNPEAIKHRKAEDRRGLLVINDTMNHGKLACDPYWDLYQQPFDPISGTGCIGALYAYSNPNKFAKNPFICFGGEDETAFPAASLNVRRGFVLGVNGMLDVYHDMFLDYVAGTVNRVDDLAACCYDPCTIKKRNPSALIIDGLDPRLFCRPGCNEIFTGNPYTCASSEFEAANPWTQGDAVRNATIHLRGNGSIYMRSSASSVDGYMFNYWFDYDGPYIHAQDGSRAPELDPALDYVKHLSVGAMIPSYIGDLNCPQAIVCAERSSYDGISLSPNTQTTLEPCGGEHVLDVECDLTVCSVSNAATRLDPFVPCGSNADCGAYRDYGYTVDHAGVIKMLSVVVDHAGREIYFDESNQPVLVNRPMFPSGSIETDYYPVQHGVPLALNEQIYCRYNSPGIFLNSNMSLYESHLIHSDATKRVDGVPSSSEPAITGGEKLYFSTNTIAPAVIDAHCGTQGDPVPVVKLDPYRFRLPELRLYNSVVHLHESLASSGLRWVVNDRPNIVCPAGAHNDGNNVSDIKFYDHGDCWDTLLTSWGRIFMLGSNLNKMSGIEAAKVLECVDCLRPCTNDVLQSAYMNVFRSKAPQEGAAIADIRLLLSNGDQFNAGVPSNLWNIERAQHLFILGMTDKGQSNVHVGWPVPAGFDQVFPHVYPYPADALIALPDADHAFGLDSLHVPQATLRVNGKVITFGAFNGKGEARKVPFKGADESGVVYVDHGGRLDITADSKTGALDLANNAALRNIVSSELIVDTIIGQRVWSDFSPNGEVRKTGYTGCIDLPHDQVTFINGYAIQPFNFTSTMFEIGRGEGNQGWVRLPYINSHRGPSFDKTGGEEVSIAWHHRDCQGYPHAVPTKGRASSYLTRATESLGAAVARPQDLLYVGPGDDIAQMKVAGATLADPFHLAVRGGATTPAIARVREFVTQKTQTGLVHEHFIGEDGHAVLFVQNGGHIGLGSRNWNEQSVNAWSLLGKDFVTVCPLGDGVVDVNSNLLVTDRLPIVCSSDFKAHRLTFYSEEPREIRVPANSELDLSSFGGGLAAGQHQEIAFAGQLRLVFEPGATLRLPSNDGLVLYFNDESQLIFEGETSRQGRRPNFANAAAANDERTKIVGKGQIWVNKDASVQVNGGVLVGVQTDDLSNQTNVTVSIQRQGQFNVGTSQLAGGAFEVGNPLNRGAGHSVNFSLVLNGPEATFRIGRQGFVGFGAGVINKQDNMNGAATVAANPVMLGESSALGEDGRPVFTPDPVGAWQIIALHNVASVNLNVTNGIIEHKIMKDGSDPASSLLAVGSISLANVVLGGSDHAIVRGGGNVMFVPASSTIFKANVWDFDGTLSNGERYCMMNSGPLLRDRTADDNNDDTAQNFNNLTAAALFELLACRKIEAQASPKVVLTSDDFEASAGFTSSDEKYPTGALINRIESPSTVQDGGNIKESLNIGALAAATGANGLPEAMAPINQ